MQRLSFIRRFSGLIFLVLLWATLGIAISQRQAIADWWALRDYQPSNDIARLADDITLTDQGRKLFYVYKPKIEPASQFNVHCRDGEYTIVLGCYVSQTGIYLFRVEDERLQGIKQVTAAHEMLHVAYERLSDSERRRIDELTNQVYGQLDNQRLLDNIAQYRKADSSVVPNELHSILGSEVRDLPSELEEYYSRYFKDRSKIVAFSEHYEAAFTERQTAAEDYSKQLSSLKTKIDANTNKLELEARRLQKEYAAIENSRGQASNASLNQRARAYNAAVADYNNLADQTRTLIERYNSIVEQYNAVVLEQHDLRRAIDSAPQDI